LGEDQKLKEMKILAVIISILVFAKLSSGEIFQFPSNFWFGASSGKF
jgi:hypothetical protein